MYSGHNTHRRNGVGMIIANRVSKSLIGYRAVNDRIIYIRVRAHPVNITFVQVYIQLPLFYATNTIKNNLKTIKDKKRTTKQP
jgi:hypothetical protein